MRTVLLTLHIIGAGAWIGANIGQLLTTNRLADRGGREAAAWMETVAIWGRTLYTPAAVVLLATGIGLVLDSPFYEFSNAFVSIGFLAVAAGAAIGIAIIAKSSQRAAAAFAGGDPTSAAAEVKKVVTWASVDSMIILVTLVAMVGRWGA